MAARPRYAYNELFQEDIMIVLMCQEDFILMNPLAIEKGLFRSQSVKKYSISLQTEYINNVMES